MRHLQCSLQSRRQRLRRLPKNPLPKNLLLKIKVNLHRRQRRMNLRRKAQPLKQTRSQRRSHLSIFEPYQKVVQPRIQKASITSRRCRSIK